jgi:hypothetical protein
MKKIAIFITAIVVTINLHGQVDDSFIGKYTVNDIWKDTFSGYNDTSIYTINIIKNNDIQIFILNFAQSFDTIRAIVNFDSIHILSQVLYHNETNFFIIQGDGIFCGDTLKYHYTSGGPRGAFEGNCIAVKVKENSIIELYEYGGIFKCYPNPFSANTTIKMYVPNTVSRSTLYIYNMQGEQINQIAVNERGNTSVIIEGYTLKAGMYLYTLITDGKEVDTKKMILTK